MNFKDKYKDKWREGLQRQIYAMEWIKENLPQDIAVVVSASVTGKGANTTERVDDTGTEKNAPDYLLKHKETKAPLIHIEVTRFVERKPDYWLLPGKIDYAQRHKDKDFWAIAVDIKANPPALRIIKPDNEKVYKSEMTFINERMVVFYDSDPEVIPAKDFLEYVETKTRLED